MRSASGAPFGGIYFGRFSRFKFDMGVDGVRLAVLIMNSIHVNECHSIKSLVRSNSKQVCIPCSFSCCSMRVDMFNVRIFSRAFSSRSA
jgi:hypothetical protein